MDNLIKVGGGKSLKTQTVSTTTTLPATTGTWVNVTFNELTEVKGISSFLRSGGTSVRYAQAIATEDNPTTDGLSISGNVVSFYSYNRTASQSVTFTLTAVGF